MAKYELVKTADPKGRTSFKVEGRKRMQKVVLGDATQKQLEILFKLGHALVKETSTAGPSSGKP